MVTINRKDYAALYGPTTGDSVRLGDTSLVAVVEKTMLSTATSAFTAAARRCVMELAWRDHQRPGALDFLLCNVLLIDPVLGIVKGDLGIRHGDCRIRQGREPAIMDNVDPRLIVSTGTTVRDCEGLIATPRAIESTSISTVPAWSSTRLRAGHDDDRGSRRSRSVSIQRPFNTGKMLQAAEAWR